MSNDYDVALPGVHGAPNIQTAPEIYELENQAAGPEGLIEAAMWRIAPWAGKARWWGPAGFANTFHTFEPRPGGWWRFTMRGPDGAEYDMENRFAEVVPAGSSDEAKPLRIVLQHLAPGHRFRMLMSFADEAGKTRLTWHLRFESAEEAEQARAPISAANEQNFDRLQAQLDAMGRVAGCVSGAWRSRWTALR